MINVLSWWDDLGRPFARMPRWGAVITLALLAAAMIWAAFASTEAIESGESEAAQTQVDGGADDGDIALYRKVAERVAEGESYYAAVAQEHRARNYPLYPFVAVRLPALAWMHGMIGSDGVRLACLLALMGAAAGLYRHIVVQAGEGAGNGAGASSGAQAAERIGAVMMMVLAGAAIASPTASLLHAVPAGLLLTLATVWYRPDRWWPSLLAMALALSVRELALPFALLWLAFAVTGRRWKEAGAIVGVLVAFAAMMALHYGAVDAQRLAGDGSSQGWDGMLGYALPLSAITQLTPLLALPLALAGPLAILPLVGWLGLGGRIGLFAALWCAGFYTAMALFARPDNFYWAQLTLPLYFAGIAFAPRAIADLIVSLSREHRGTGGD